MNDIEKVVFDSIIKPILKEEDGIHYVDQDDIDNLNISASERDFLFYVLKLNGIVVLQDDYSMLDSIIAHFSEEERDLFSKYIFDAYRIAEKMAKTYSVDKLNVESYALDGLIFGIKTYDGNLDINVHIQRKIRYYIKKCIAKEKGLSVNTFYAIHSIIKNAEKRFLRDFTIFDEDMIEYIINTLINRRIISFYDKEKYRNILKRKEISLNEFAQEYDLKDELKLTMEERLDMQSIFDNLHEKLKTLDSRQREVIKLYYGLDGENPKKLDEIAEIFNLSRERIRQILKKSLYLMRSKSSVKKLFPYDGNLSYYDNLTRIEQIDNNQSNNLLN